MAAVTSSFPAPHVAIITLADEPLLNAMGEDMARDFREVVCQLAGKKELRSVILTGAGKAFSAGGHLEMLDKKRLLSGEENRIAMHHFYDSFLSILSLKLPLIAAINGAAIGAGLCVACACDIRIASSDAKLGFTFTKLGLHPGMGGTFLLPRIIGHARASELLLTAKIVSAEDARVFGLVSEVVSRDQLISRATAIAHEIAACGPEATRQLVETVRGDLIGLETALDREALCQSINYVGKEFSEGITAMREKRSPKFG